MSNREDDSSDEQKYHQYGMELRASVERAIVPWLTRTIEARGGDPLVDEIARAIDSVAQIALENITELIEADVDRPLSGPLEQIRRAISPLGPVLDAHGCARPQRDPYDVQMRPDDVFDLGPLSFIDLGEQVQSAGITWGAAKAHLHNSRRRSDS